MRLAAIAVLLCLAAGPASAADSIGSVTKMQGQAHGGLAGADVVLQVGTAIFADEKLTTGAKTRLEVTFVDGTKITIGEKASLTVDKFVYKPRSLGNVLDAAVTGPFRFVSGKLDKTSAGSARVVTAFATIGIRGTDFWGGPIDGHNGVVLLSGAITVRNALGRTDLSKPGQGSDIITLDTPPRRATMWPKEKVSRALATVTIK